MIRYALACEAGHAFESWFRSSDDFDAQAARGLVACPHCGSAKVLKQIMAPQVARTDLARTDPARAETGSPVTQDRPVALIDPEAQALRAKIAELRAHLVANSEDVGTKFAEEARKIHYGESEQRSIRGHASAEDARALIEEGVEFLPIPSLPDERN